MRFQDARAAGCALAEGLAAYDARERTIVVAVARGGVAVALEVSKRLGLPLDLLLLRRLLVTRGPLEPICAVNVAGQPFLDDELARPGAEPALVPYVADAVADLESRTRACRGTRPPAELEGRTVLLVDNGVRTGSTMLAALRALRSSCAPGRVVAAAPVAAPEALAVVRGAADDFIYLSTPDPFGHVGLWYSDFARPSDDQIRAMLKEAEGRQ